MLYILDLKEEDMGESGKDRSEEVGVWEWDLGNKYSIKHNNNTQFKLTIQ
jgi:hypothetical protein